MSVFRDDPNSIKQNFIILICTLLAIILFLFSGSGARLECKEEGECSLLRKTIHKKTSLNFKWGTVKDIRYTLSGGASYSKKGVSGVNYSLITHDEKEIPIYQNPIAYPMGSLTIENMKMNLGKNWEDNLWGVSLGGVTWFISFSLGCVSFVLVLLMNVTPIHKELNPYELEKARKHNLIVFIITVSSFLLFWFLVLGSMIYYFIN